MKNKILLTLLPILILAAGVAVAWLFVKNPNVAKKRDIVKPKSVVVQTASPEIGDYIVKVEAIGQIAPALQVNLKPKVGGEIVEVSDNFLPGGFLKAGEDILSIEKVDYQLELQKQEAIYKQVKADFRMEVGRQKAAKSELDVLAKTTGKKLSNPALALRKPQLEQAKAELERAKADLDIAKLNLERTSVKAPFNAIITQRNAVLGDNISVQDNLATLAGTDQYWVRVSVPISELKWLDIAHEEQESGSLAQIILGEGRGMREGYLTKVTGMLDTRSRLADIIVSVPDPLLLQEENRKPGTFPLIIGDYVRVVISGKMLKNTTRIPLSWLRGTNTVWVEQDGQLRFKQIDIAHEDRQYAYVEQGLDNLDKIIVSSISTPLDGMKIRLQNELQDKIEQAPPAQEPIEVIEEKKYEPMKFELSPVPGT